MNHNTKKLAIQQNAHHPSGRLGHYLITFLPKYRKICEGNEQGFNDLGKKTGNLEREKVMTEGKEARI